MYLRIENITKRYGDFTAVDDVSVEVDSDEFVCLLGPSGCGKTTLLRMVSGLIQPDGGKILLDGQDIRPVPARNRNFGIVFQSYSLFPNMTVAENIGYGLKIRNATKARIHGRVSELLELIGLPEIADNYPHQISGGQQQRVALARAIAIDPKLLLLDEPLSALDAKVRLALRTEVRNLQRRLNIPTLMVTHDQEEAMAMADQVVCMNAGRVEQVGSPTDLYARPTSEFVATFLGRMNVLDFDRGARIGEHSLQASADISADRIRLYVRPEHIALLKPDESSDAENIFPATVIDSVFEGNITRYRVVADGHELEVEKLGRPAHEDGGAVSVAIRARDLQVIGSAS